MRIYTIYMATNMVNGKRYIGFDSAWPNRQKDHLKKAFGKYNQQNKYYFHRAIQKHGRDNFEWSILYQSLDGEHTKNVMENHFITEYRTFREFPDCNGYNLSLGGDGNLGRKHSAEAIDKMIRNKTGKLTARSRPVATPYGIFDSLAAATVVTTQYGSSKGMMHVRLRSPYFPEWFFVDTPKVAPVTKQRRHTAPSVRRRRAVTTPNGVFESAEAAAIALQIGIQIVRYRIHSGRYLDWYYTKGDALTPTTVSPKRTTIRTQLIQTPLGTFPGLVSASAATNLLPGTIRYRLNSANYPDWQWAGLVTD